MRSAILELLASAAIVSATGCAQSNLDDLVARISCGTNKEISQCLHRDIDLAWLEEIEDCLISGGCSMADATAEAVWFTFDCRAKQEELKRRQNDEETTTEESTTEEKTTTKKTASRSASAKRTSTTAPSSTEATTTSESTTESTTTSTSSESTVTSTTSTSSQSTITKSTETAQSATTTGPLVCSVTSTKATSMCFVSAGKTQSCVATTTEIASCAPGMICFSAAAGANSCMRRDNHLTTSGIVVAIAFGVGIAATTIAVIAMIIHGKNKVKANRQAQLLAVASSRGRGGRDVEAAKGFSKPMTSDANLPLITPGGPRSDQPIYGQQEYFEGAGQAMRSLTPPEYRSVSGSGAPPVPRLELHQGLGALGQNPRY
ncbi:hypothetical protein ONS95_005065 [Cadophora gregata]|uniref:uncharacterized protein n=1 Tax=Cadophora gregata TaxID=51156 RepID=UPI0026DCE782|nr:uncharacterized protein ONS95_005065 [Cadophora gregata]KAK0104797.1 hypothetical protein ONS95_005065 [Cadophora gregata]KAK0115119.1 hypothetical protein ONS96_013589 [Cadophora gregata f. sp. sojae]